MFDNMIKDEGCPTCGSKNYGNIEMKNTDGNVTLENQCHNCKKFWYSVKNR